MPLSFAHSSSASPTFPTSSHSLFSFFNATPPSEIYTLSLHDALPISPEPRGMRSFDADLPVMDSAVATITEDGQIRSEEHTSELQSHSDLVCRLLLEKKKRIREAHRCGSGAAITERRQE